MAVVTSQNYWILLQQQQQVNLPTCTPAKWSAHWKCIYHQSKSIDRLVCNLHQRRLNFYVGELACRERSWTIATTIYNHLSRFVFNGLREPNRAWLLVVYVFMPRPLLSLYVIIYVTWHTSHLPEPTRWSECGSHETIVFTYQIATSHALLAHGKCNSALLYE